MTSVPASSNSSNEPVWGSPDLANPHVKADKAERVQKMFSAIAPSYDLNNRLHSFGCDQAWRKFAVKAAGVKAGETVLDVACGTGDLTEAFAGSAAGKVIGADFTPAMLEVARDKARARGEAIRAKIEYREGDATNLAFDSASVDVVSIAFGIRNVSEPKKAISEFFRVLRPGGRVVILEFDKPRSWPMNWGYDFYCGWLMPRTAALIAGDKSGAYRYLPASVGSFMSREEMKSALSAAGFRNVTAKALTLGICVCYVGEKA